MYALEGPSYNPPGPSGGLTGGQKAGIAIGVLIAVGIVGAALFVFRHRIRHRLFNRGAPLAKSGAYGGKGSYISSAASPYATI